MSTSIIVRAKSVKANLEKLFDETRPIFVRQKATIEVLCQQYETKARIIKEKLMRPEKYIGTPTNGTDTIIILSIYEDDIELALKRLTRNKEQSN
ncbi:unnamed protein product [Brugia pahangi]|uniref:Transcriptional regulator n=1 Tax=Brugia pahangi TaxID=6280 RepID=A0A0N4T482_BRUPA|nr:unnamed protein product [Brugia pahangi]